MSQGSSVTFPGTIIVPGLEDTGNSTTTALSASNSWTGSAIDVSRYPSVVIAAKTDKDGVVSMQFSPDGTNWDSTLSFSVTSGSNEVHRLSVTRKYYRALFANTSAEDQGFLRLQTILGSQNLLTSPLNSSIQSDADAIVTRGVLTGQTDGGQFVNVPVTPEGHLEVAMHDPLLPFGSIHTEQLTAVMQHDAVYGADTNTLIRTTTLSGTASASDSSFVCNTGTTIYSQASIQSRRRLKYRPGQGSVGRFTAIFTQGVADSYQVAGFGHAEDGVYYAYSGSSFGILYTQRGTREIQRLDLTSASTSTGLATITLAGVQTQVSVSNSSNLFRTAYEISSGSYTGWSAYPSGSSVYFLASSVGNKTGAFNATGSGVTGSYTEVRAGGPAIEQFISQSSWNIDTMDGTGPSGYSLDPTKGNVYQINIRYLGHGNIDFKVLTSATGNNPTWTNVHSIPLQNNVTASSFRTPSFPFTMAVYSAGSTTDLQLKCSSFAGFIEGKQFYTGPRTTFTSTSTNVDAASYVPIFTIQNPLTFRGQANQIVAYILDLSCAVKHTQPSSFYLIRNGSLVGNVNFQKYSNESCLLIDSGSTGVTFDNSKLMWIGNLSDTNNLLKDFDSSAETMTLQPGEILTLAARTSGGSAAYAAGSINIRED